MSIIPINLSGTLAADPQSRTLPSGRACASFRLAVNHWRLDKATGEYAAEPTSWFSVDCYGPLASNCSMSLHRGMFVVVQGTLKIREWSTEEKSGIAPTVVAEHIGPDLRYGTAHYQKASGANRQQDGPQQAGAGSESGWGALDSEVAGGAPESSAESSLDSSHDVEGTVDDEAPTEDGGDSGNVDDAIARDTVNAAAPF
ncbi:MAG: single-stranded DNA-binding protein [Brevibacterium sp.]|nr:single-stranded DNA-binding protein [Brevibacterium sp.]MDN5832824.1 single-stranded DNA-binding protein [Brevibacterium sp.]MDN5875341.1 single-stranded DNA-binding protein [Brevibacterium sp.]MDN5908059.1 single-stranded DNA-binding protein [Brevibacterium sp.]MDN6133651.1 single-stranded DNA-binding protein [Brevibacterium sp.]